MENYNLKDLTITDWAEIMKLKGLLDEDEIEIKIIEFVTGLTRDELVAMDKENLSLLSNSIAQWNNRYEKMTFDTMVHKEQEYRLVDVNNISFGQFIDIDTFMGQPENYRLTNLNELAAYLYVEVIDGKPIEYSDSNFNKRIEDMKDLPVKYIDGALFFLLGSGKELRKPTRIFSRKEWKWRMKKMTMKEKIKHLVSIGGGIQRLVLSQKTTLRKLTTLLNSLWLVVSTTLLTLVTYPVNRIKNRIKSK